MEFSQRDMKGLEIPEGTAACGATWRSAACAQGAQSGPAPGSTLPCSGAVDQVSKLQRGFAPAVFIRLKAAVSQFVGATASHNACPQWTWITHALPCVVTPCYVPTAQTAPGCLRLVAEFAKGVYALQSHASFQGQSAGGFDEPYSQSTHS